MSKSSAVISYYKDIIVVSIWLHNRENETLIVPIREGFNFNGWFLPWSLSYKSALQVSDEHGNYVGTKEIFDSKESSDLYAKWTAVEEVTYKILMVYVTEVYAKVFV